MSTPELRVKVVNHRTHYNSLNDSKRLKGKRVEMVPLLLYIELRNLFDRVKKVYR